MITFPLAVDWSTYFGGWDMTGLLAASAAGAAPLAVLVVARVGIWLAFAVIAYARRLV
jgi:hypothetical protein